MISQIRFATVRYKITSDHKGIHIHIQNIRAQENKIARKTLVEFEIPSNVHLMQA